MYSAGAHKLSNATTYPIQVSKSSYLLRNYYIEMVVQSTVTFIRRSFCLVGGGGGN
jgi:hypothetical protein